MPSARDYSNAAAPCTKTALHEATLLITASIWATKTKKNLKRVHEKGCARAVYDNCARAGAIACANARAKASARERARDERKSAREIRRRDARKRDSNASFAVTTRMACSTCGRCERICVCSHAHARLKVRKHCADALLQTPGSLPKPAKADVPKLT
eukprot:4364113-Pleurochrysis_carterae.AAC.5